MKYLMLILAFVLSAQPALAAVMNSSNYQMERDSINFAGTDASSSSNYRLDDTVGEVATGPSASTGFNLTAGYRQMDGSYITISQEADISLSPDILGTSGGTADGQGTWTVVTNDNSGYTLKVKSSTNPTLQTVTDTIPDYAPATAAPDYDWTMATSAIGFGFTPEGTTISQRYLDNGSACNTGSAENTNQCWDGLAMTDKNIAVSSAKNDPTGTTTTLKFRAENGVNNFQPSGHYTGTVTLTAVIN